MLQALEHHKDAKISVGCSQKGKPKLRLECHAGREGYDSQSLPSEEIHVNRNEQG